jgi:hypothetical protein
VGAARATLKGTAFLLIPAGVARVCEGCVARVRRTALEWAWRCRTLKPDAQLDGRFCVQAWRLLAPGAAYLMITSGETRGQAVWRPELGTDSWCRSHLSASLTPERAVQNNRVLQCPVP